MATIADLLVKLRMDGTGLDSGMDASQSKLKSWGTSMRQVGKMATLGVSLPLVAAGGVAIKWAADLDESINKTKVLFGDQSDELIAWSETSAKTMGMSQQATLDYAGSFGGMLNTVASGPEELRGMSTELTQLTADFASFHNMSPEEAFTVIASGLAGEAEAIRRYGVDMSAANVEQVALSMGLADTAENLTAQDKALARYQILLNETTEEQGDFARTSKSVSNQLKIARARVQDVGVSFGRIMLPYVQQALIAFGDLLDKFESLDPKWQKIILAVAAVAAAIGPLLIIIGMMLPAIGALGVVIGALLSPIGLLVIAIAALIGLGIYAWANDLWGVRDAVSDLMDVLDLFRPALDDLIDAFQALREGDWDEVFYELRDAILTFADVFMSEVVPRVLAGLQAVAQAFVDWASSVDWIGLLSTVGSAIIQGIRAGAEAAWPVIVQFFSQVPGWLTTGLGFLWEEILKPGGTLLIAGLHTAITTAWPIVSTWLVGLPGYILAAVGDLARTLRQKGLDLFAGLHDGILDKWATVKYWLIGTGAYVYAAIGDVSRIIRQKGLDLFAGLYDGILDKWASVKSWLSGVGTYVVLAVGNLGSTLYGAGSALINGFKAGIVNAASAIYAEVKGIVDNIIDLLSNVPGFSPIAHVGQFYGKQLAGGFADGIAGMEDAVAGAAGGVVGAGIAPFNANADAGGYGRGQIIQIITLEPSRWQEFLSDAQAGGNFARSFSSELGLRTGAP